MFIAKKTSEKYKTLNEIRCDLCGKEMSRLKYKDHLRSCIFSNDGHIHDIEGYPRILTKIAKYGRFDDVAFFVNTIRNYHDFFRPCLDRDGPTFIPIERITDVIVKGLTKKKIDEGYYMDVCEILKKFLKVLTTEVSFSRVSEDPYYIASILSMFNKIYETKLEGAMDVKPFYEGVIAANETKIAHAWFRFSDTSGSRFGLPTKLLFYDEELLYDCLLCDILEDPNEREVIKTLNNATSNYLFIDAGGQNILTRNKHVIQVYIVSLELESIPESIHYLKDLEFLLVHGKNLKFIPKTIERLQKLKVLIIGAPKMEDFPKCICNLSNLENLRITDTKITEIPSTISRLVNIKDIDLSRNALKTLPSSIGKLHSLEWLKLSNNDPSFSLPNTIRKLKSLNPFNDLGLDNR